MAAEDDTRAEFRRLFELSGLRQKELASLLGNRDMTVNRWFADRSDAVMPPYYAVNFLRAYLMLTPEQRESLPRK
ncbi:hypothetical protein [Brucella sp. 10RB9215]|uniref:hypothetical protein n=1 Tax=Brucella sp. 10RB9215 TaxID=1149953 RepID=UPI0010FE718F|nr:hypothetical protein [Brucella sp. 10RB9215]